jgi:hypothetical protein
MTLPTTPDQQRAIAAVDRAVAKSGFARTSPQLELNERGFQRQVTDLAALLGWEHVHFRPAQTAKGWRTPVSGTLGAGFVDLVLVRAKDHRLIFAELKAEKGRLTYEQDRVLDVLRSLTTDQYGAPTSIEVHVWRPSDLDEIAEVLR